jgi:hypothetical protein
LPNRNAVERRDQRLELFGKAKYGPQWVVLREDELKHIKNVGTPSTVRSDVLEGPRSRPLYGSWRDQPLFVYIGPPEDQEAAQSAWTRFLISEDQHSEIKEIFRLLDRYGVGSEPQQGSPCTLDPLERLRPGDDRTEIERARDLYWLIVFEQSAVRPSAIERAAHKSPPPTVEPDLSRLSMSEDNDWNATVERVGVPVFANSVLYVRCGLGRKGLEWGYPHPGRDSVPADKWRPLREEALATTT